jgi:cobyrinic acid a,c-diamide synthase
MTKTLLIAAPRSRAGKTTVTLGLLAALGRRGPPVASAKCGPDYIDPAFHEALTGRPSLNLDGWAMREGLLAALLGEAAADAGLLMIESAMGLFDGAGGGAGLAPGSGAALAVRFGIPVVLVLDVAAQAQSAAAELFGFARFDPRLRIAGVILNRVGSDRHRAMIDAAIRPLGIPVIGALPRDRLLHLPERHLGLVQAGEQAGLKLLFERLADLVEAHCDLDLLAALAADLAAEPRRMLALAPPGQRIALACDTAFSFVYPHLIDGWRRAGAEIVKFSPLADEPPPQACDACWLPGGYPELHAGRLAAAAGFKSGLARFAADRPVHGECGGYMVLGRALIDGDGAAHEMPGLLGHVASFAAPRLHLGYRRARLLSDCALGAAGAAFNGHEFHYASLIEPGSDAPLAAFTDAEGRDLGPSGGRRGRVSGAFFHVIASADPAPIHAAQPHMEPA